LPEDLNFKHFGWRGIWFKIPSDWDMVAEGGTRRNGYLRIDDPVRPRLEVKWEHVDFEKAGTPEKIAENYVENLRKDFLKRAKKIAKQRKIKVEEVKIPEIKILSREELKIMDHDAYLMHIRTEEEALFLTWYCEKRELQISLQLNFKGNEYAVQKAIFDKVINTAVCHSEDGWSGWTLYGFVVFAPYDVELIARKMTTGLSYIVMEADKRKTFYAFAYSSMANVLIGEYYSDLKDWYVKNMVKQALKPIGRVKMEDFVDGAVLGHEAKIVTASIPSILKSRKYYGKGAVWLCDKSNRVLSVLVLNKGESADGLFEKIMSGSRCH